MGRVRLEHHTTTGIQESNLHTLFFIVIKSPKFSINPNLPILEPLLDKQSTHLNEKIRVSAVAGDGAKTMIQIRNSPQKSTAPAVSGMPSLPATRSSASALALSHLEKIKLLVLGVKPED